MGAPTTRDDDLVAEFCRASARPRPIPDPPPVTKMVLPESFVRFWSDRYIQHSAHIAPGRAGLFDLIRTLPDTLRHENQLIVAEGDYVIAHGRLGGGVVALVE
jgi:hypothetical protein